MMEKPSLELWLKEAKKHEWAPKCGMYLIHNGTVRVTPKVKVRDGADTDAEVSAMMFSYKEDVLDEIISEAYKLDGIYYIRTWLNNGLLRAGDDIMYVLVGGDIRPRVINALEYIVGRIKNECVIETEIY